MQVILPCNCKPISNLATDVNTGHCRDLCYAVNAVYAQQELYEGSLRMQLGGEARVEEEEERWKKLNGEKIGCLGQSVRRMRHRVMTCH